MDIQKITEILVSLSCARSLNHARKVILVAGPKDNNTVLKFLDNLSIYGSDALDEVRKSEIQLKATLWVIEYKKKLEAGIDVSNLENETIEESEDENEIKTYALMLHDDLESLINDDYANISRSIIRGGADCVLECLMPLINKK